MKEEPNALATAINAVTLAMRQRLPVKIFHDHTQTGVFEVTVNEKLLLTCRDMKKAKRE